MPHSVTYCEAYAGESCAILSFDGLAWYQHARRLRPARDLLITRYRQFRWTINKNERVKLWVDNQLVINQWTSLAVRARGGVRRPHQSCRCLSQQAWRCSREQESSLTSLPSKHVKTTAGSERDISVRYYRPQSYTSPSTVRKTEAFSPSPAHGSIARQTPTGPLPM
eukprot:767583-Hanusia_phi.AAC.4